MSACLSAKGAYGFNLDLIKSPSSSSVTTSTLSKSSSVSSFSIITKRSRTPRKRPNQSYIEAAARLSTACPKVFSTNNLHKKHSTLLSSLSASSLTSSEFLPPFAVPNESDFLIESSSHDPNPSSQFKFRPFSTNERSCAGFRESSPPKSMDYDADSFFDDEVVEGIDSIIGKLSMNDYDSSANPNPFVWSSMRSGLGKNMRHALRGVHDEGWWSPMMMVQMKDIAPKFSALPSSERKNPKIKKKKKVEKEVNDAFEVINIAFPTSTTTTTPCKFDGKLMSGLGLKLNHEEVIKAWGDSGFPISYDSVTMESSTEITARLAKINLSPDNEGGGIREAHILRYREKRRSRHFSKKISYQVRKVNADCRPRIKGRFVKRNRSSEEATEEDGA